MRLRQILLNLVGNAIKFTHQGEVVVDVQVESLAKDDAVLHFRVIDTGIGIPDDKKSLIFDAFEQADTSTTREYGGTGLGLAISRRLVGMMNGQIWVESEIGRGSMFHFTAAVGFSRRRAAGSTLPRRGGRHARPGGGRPSHESRNPGRDPGLPADGCPRRGELERGDFRTAGGRTRGRRRSPW